jgi:uncharacterized repeat protein (TIGR01451 family)
MVAIKGHSRFFRWVLLAALVLSPWLDQPALAHTESAGDPLPKDVADASNNLLQFQSDGHVLGFAPDGMLVSNGTYALRVEFVDANAVTPQAAENGAAEDGAAPQLTQVTYPDLWDGITLAYDADGGLARSTYTVVPGSDPAAIRLRYNAPVAVEADGSLRIDYETGELCESAPVAWQEIDGARVPVEVRFALLSSPAWRGSGDEVGFRLGPYDSRYPLTIDPTLIWNTFLGGKGSDGGFDVAVDGNGNIYMAGISYAPWGSPVQAYGGDVDTFVAKLTEDGNLIWNTFLGGDRCGLGIAVDGSGNVYVVGEISSDDIYLAKLDSNGNLTWETRLGKSYGIDIAVDGIENVYVTGRSNTTWGSPIRAYTGDSDAFVAKLGSDGSLTWNTFLGGSGDDGGNAIAVDGSGSVYVAGASGSAWSCSPAACTVRAYSGGHDAFVAQLGSDGSLTWNTFLGGSNQDFGLGIAVDNNGDVYVTGTSAAPWGSPVRGYTVGEDTFAAQLSSNGSLTWNTFLGGSGIDYGIDIAVDGIENVYVTGRSNTTWGSPVRGYTAGEDTFAAQLSSDGSLTWNTFLGGSGFDEGRGIAVDDSRSVYIAGRSDANWGSPVRAYGGHDAFVFKLAPLALTQFVSPVLARPGEAITYTIAFSNTDIITATTVIITDTLSSNITNANSAISGVTLTQVAGSRYAWTAPDLARDEGGMITLTGTLVKPLVAGVFTNTVTLAVSGTTKMVNAPLTVQNVAPVANAGADQTVDLGGTVVLDGSGSYDDNGDVLTYTWKQTGGIPTVTLSDSTAQSSTFIALGMPTVLTFTLAVTDAHSVTDIDEIVVRVKETRSKPSVVKTVSPALARPGEVVTYTIAFSNTGEVAATHVTLIDTLSANLMNVGYTRQGMALTQVPGFRYLWTAPDLAQNEGGIITLTGVLTKPLAAGTFTNTVTLAVSGTFKTASVPLTVMNVAPTADAGTDRTVAPGAVVTLRGSGSSDDNGDALTYTWAQTGGPDVALSGATTTTASFTAGLTIPTVYTFTLTVDDGESDDTDTVVITVARYACYLPLVL